MEEFLKRLAEIRDRAAEIAKMDVIDEEARNELRALRDERTELETKIGDAELVAELTAEIPVPKSEAGDGEGEGEGGEGAPVEKPAEEPAEGGEGEGAPAEAPTPEAIAAAVSAGSPKDNDIPQSGGQDGLTIMASSSAFGLQVGTRMEAEDWQRVMRVAGKQGEGRHVFATIDRSNGRKAVSGRNSAIENSLIMSQDTEEAAALPLTAAACYCGPFETSKEILSLGLDDRPIAGMFRSVPVTGPFKYVRDINLADVDAGVTLWDCTDQDNVVVGTPATYKPCVELSCLPDHQVDPYAIPACGRFSIFQQVSHPELIDDFITKLGIVYARRAEQALLDTLRADSTVLTYAPGNGQGLLNSIEAVLGHLAGFSGYVRRIDWGSYALVLPPGLIDALITDEHRRGFSRGANRADILAQLRELGVGQVVEARDADTTAEANYLAAHGLYVDPGNTVAFDPCTAIGTWTLNVVPVSAYTRGESTLVEAGFQRDADLTLANMVQWFFEGNEFLEKMTPDVPSYTLEIGGAGTGGTTALVGPTETC